MPVDEVSSSRIGACTSGPSKSPVATKCQGKSRGRRLSGQDCFDQLVAARCLEQYVAQRKCLRRKEEGHGGQTGREPKDINTCAIGQIRTDQLTPGELLMESHYPHRHMVYDSLKKKLNKKTHHQQHPLSQFTEM